MRKIDEVLVDGNTPQMLQQYKRSLPTDVWFVLSSCPVHNDQSNLGDCLISTIIFIRPIINKY